MPTGTFNGEVTLDRVTRAQRYLRAVYGGDPEALDDLASPDVVISYPLFQEVLGVPAIRGREAAKAFVVRFAGRWADPRIEFHDSVAEGDKVVLVWSFAARMATPPESSDESGGGDRAWGGITLIRFDPSGRVVSEVGEESTPGPSGRLRGLEGHSNGEAE